MNQHRAINAIINKLDLSLKKPLDAIHNRTKAPGFMILTQMLSVISIASQQLVDISPKREMKIPTSLYILILAASGERKSTVDKLIMKPVREFEELLAVHTENALIDYQIEIELWDMRKKVLKTQLDEMYKKNESNSILIEAWRALSANKPIPPIPTRILAEDITVSKLKSMLAGKNTSLALVSDEAGTLLSSDLMKDNSLFNSLWSGQTIRVDRANKSEAFIEGARLTINIQIQPDIYKAIRVRNGDVMRNSGLDARFLLCKPESEIGYRFEDSGDTLSAEQERYIREFKLRIDTLLKEGFELRQQGRERYCLKLTDKAEVVWNEKFNEIEYAMRRGEYLENYKDFGSKFMEQASRIAAVLHVFRHKDYSDLLVDHETMQTAIELMDIYLQQVLISYLASESREFTDESHADKLLAWIMGSWKNELILRSEVRRSGPHCVRNLDKLKDAIEILNARGDIVCFKNKKSNFISLSWHKYPDLVMRSSLCTRDGISFSDLIRCGDRRHSTIRIDRVLRGVRRMRGIRDFKLF